LTTVEESFCAAPPYDWLRRLSTRRKNEHANF